VPALWTLGQHISTLVSCGVDRNKICVIINRWQHRDEEAVKAVEKNIKRPVFARLPDDPRQVSQATNLGVPLSISHDDPLGVKFRQLACWLAGCVSSKSGCFAKSATCKNLTSGRLSHVDWAHDPVSSGFCLLVRFLLPLPT
jgi:hypothetical protein